MSSLSRASAPACSSSTPRPTLSDPAEPWLPLAGVRIVDFSMFVPGPFASAILSDLGADVIKVEMPTGDPGRSYVPVQFETENRNKRSLALDLKNAAAKDIVQRLARNAHIALEGFRPGVAKRLSIDFETLRKVNPKLVYCSISGYGQTGPWGERPGHDVNYVAAAGALAFPGQWLKPPARSSLPIADMGGGAFAAIAILAALHEAKGAYLDVSLFETADGRRLTLGILEEHFWKNFVRLAPELEDERFASDALRRKHGDALSRELERVMRTKTAPE